MVFLSRGPVFLVSFAGGTRGAWGTRGISGIASSCRTSPCSRCSRGWGCTPCARGDGRWAWSLRLRRGGFNLQAQWVEGAHHDVWVLGPLQEDPLFRVVWMFFVFLRCGKLVEPFSPTDTFKGNFKWVCLKYTAPPPRRTKKRWLPGFHAHTHMVFKHIDQHMFVVAPTRNGLRLLQRFSFAWCISVGVRR